MSALTIKCLTKSTLTLIFGQLKEDHCSICGRGHMWLTANAYMGFFSLRSCQIFPLRPNMVWLMWCKWGIWNTLTIQLYLLLSHFHISRRKFSRSLDETNAFLGTVAFQNPGCKKKEQQCPIMRNLFLPVRIIRKHSSEIRHFSISRASFKSCGQLFNGLFITQKITFVNQLQTKSVPTK